MFATQPAAYAGTDAAPAHGAGTAEAYAAEQAAADAAAQEALQAVRDAEEAAARAIKARAAALRAAREAEEAERLEELLCARNAAAAAAAFPSLGELRSRPQAVSQPDEVRRQPLQLERRQPAAPRAAPRPEAAPRAAAASVESAVPEWRRRDVAPTAARLAAWERPAVPPPPLVAWGAEAAGGASGGASGGAGVGRAGLRSIQAQQEGSEEARRALGSLAGLSYSTKMAAAALLQAGGDVAVAQASSKSYKLTQSTAMEAVAELD